MSNYTPPRGLDKDQEADRNLQKVDLRTFGQKTRDFLQKPENSLYIGLGILSIFFLFPALTEILILVSLYYISYLKKLDFLLPFRTPKSSDVLDLNFLPANTKPDPKKHQPKAITYFGNEKKSNKEMWFENDDLRTHVLIFGSTGAGKTETLLSLAFNSLVQGSGLIYVDGKGDVSLFTKIFSMARRIGREDDILVINYMTGSRDVFGPQEQKLSNTLNPFASGSSGGLTELLVSLMDDGGSDGMWKGRAISLISAIMMALCYMRDNDGLLLDVDVIREYLILDNIIKLYKTRKDLPSNIRQSVRGYLVSLPGFQEGAPKQNETALEQHGYLQMQFTKLLGSLSDTYGYIFKTNLGEVDFKDVVLNRRILIVLLPALEKSSDELANLGKIIVACLKQMMAEGLGNKLEGSHAEVIDTRPTNSPTPFTTILDEYGYYSVKGAAVMPAQARSLGFSMIFAGQDYAAFKKGDEKEAESIVANCNIKIFMKLEDPMATYELFDKSVGEAVTSQVNQYQKNKNGGFFGGKYGKSESISFDMKKRGNLLDLKDQGPGEAHIIFKSALVRGQMFYANPKNAKEYRVNYFVKVEPPELKDIQQMDSSLRQLQEKINDKTHVQEVFDYVESEEDFVLQIKNSYLQHSHLAPAETAFATVAQLGSILSNLLVTEQQEIEKAKEQSAKRKINIFSDDNIDDDNSPFLSATNLKNNLSDIEKSMGATQEFANKVSDQVVEDLKQVTQYPFNGEPEEKDPDEIMEILKDVMDNFDLSDEDKSEDDSEEFDDDDDD